MKYFIIYRILGFIVNLISFLIALNLIVSLPLVFSQPFFLLFYFVLVCVVLYAWFSYTFLKKVIIQKETVKRTMKDWLLVNAIVSFIFCLLIILPGITLLINPEPFFKNLETFLKESGSGIATMDTATVHQVVYAELWALVIFCICLAIHIIWTRILVKNNANAFVDQ